MEIGCDKCRAWARIKMDRKLPVAGDTYCGDCGTREADTSKSVRALNSAKWRCKTCTHCGVGTTPKSCPNCLSEADDRHGPHTLEVQL